MAEILRTSPVGRFAPSPTGPLHFGTLVAALGSYLVSKSAAGRWLMRIEDIDRPRVVEGAADAMLRQLEELGFEWDGPVVYQSERSARYREVLADLDRSGRLFRCACSRRDIIASAPHSGEEGPVYPGTCRNGPQGTRSEYSVRLRVDDSPIHFIDEVMGRQSQNLEEQVGDFVLHRADGIFAYQLAVVVDDIDMGVTQVVRGADLLSSTARQIYLHRCLDAEIPSYYHLPLVLGAAGYKMSKRNDPDAQINSGDGAEMMWQALKFLGQNPPLEFREMPSSGQLRWGIDNFSLSLVPRSGGTVKFS